MSKKFKASKVIELFLALQVDTAKDWDFAKLSTKLEKGIRKYKEGDGDLKDEELNNLYNDIHAIQEAGGILEVEDDLTPAGAKKKKPPTEEAAPKKKAKKRDPKPKGERTPVAWSDLVKRFKKEPQPLTERGTGIIRSIINQLKEAGKGTPKPITKEDIVKVLKKEFKGRDEAKMTTTVNNQIPSRLKLVRHIHVWTGEAVSTPGKTGYYIKGDGLKEQPKAERFRRAKTEGTSKPDSGDKGKGKTKAKPAKGKAKPKAKAKKKEPAAEPSTAA
jgi:hypothetical protein